MYFNMYVQRQAASLLTLDRGYGATEGSTRNVRMEALK